MNAALLYRPQQRSRIWFALGASALIHCAAIAIAEIKRAETTTSDAGFISPEFSTIEIEDPIALDVPCATATASGNAGRDPPAR